MTQCDHEPQGPPLGSRIDPSVHSMFTLFPAVSSPPLTPPREGSDLNWAPLRNAPDSPQLTFPVQLPQGPSVDVSVLLIRMNLGNLDEDIKYPRVQIITKH